MNAHFLDRELLLRAFTMMAEELRTKRCRGEVLVAGGAVLALSYDVDRVTRDVDGLILKEHAAVIDAA